MCHIMEHVEPLTRGMGQPSCFVFHVMRIKWYMEDSQGYSKFQLDNYVNVNHIEFVDDK